MKTYDAAIVGAGIVGIAHAYHLAKAGKRVVVVERDEFAVGATIRNFGMVWVVGQPLGELRNLALRSRQIWRELLDDAKIWYRESGSLHLLYAEDELQVVQEFLDQAEGQDVGQIISPEATVRLSPQVKRDGLIGALHSATELCVDPRITAREIAEYLRTKYGVEFRFHVQASVVETGRITTADGDIVADQIFVCAGPELRRLLPDLYDQSGMRRSRLHMLRLSAPPQPIGPHLCAGLTLAHYANFRDCPSLPALKARYERELPDLQRQGIHVLVSQHGDGTLTVGDSHEYGNTFLPYLSSEVEANILRGLSQFFPTEDLRVIERWDGIYPTHSTLPFFTAEPMSQVHCTACFGTGMTFSFGVAEQTVAPLL